MADKDSRCCWDFSSRDLAVKPPRRYPLQNPNAAPCFVGEPTNARAGPFAETISRFATLERAADRSSRATDARLRGKNVSQRVKRANGHREWLPTFQGNDMQ